MEKAIETGGKLLPPVLFIDKHRLQVVKQFH